MLPACCTSTSALQPHALAHSSYPSGPLLTNCQVEKEEREWCAGLPTHVFEPWVQRLVEQHVAQRQQAAAATAVAATADAPAAACTASAAPNSLPAGTAAAMPPAVWVLNTELECVQLSKASHFGLPPDWVSLLERRDPERRQVLRVRSMVAGSSAAGQLRAGDMLLAVNGRPVTCFKDVEGAIAAAAVAGEGSADAAAAAATRAAKRRRSSQGGGAAGNGAVAGGAAAEPVAVCVGASGLHTSSEASLDAAGAASAAPPSVQLNICRAGEVCEVAVELGSEDSMGTGRLIHWCGAQVQPPHRAVRELGYVPPAAAAPGGGVYISRWHHGSPAHRYGLYALHWLTEVCMGARRAWVVARVFSGL